MVDSERRGLFDQIQYKTIQKLRLMQTKYVKRLAKSLPSRRYEKQRSRYKG